MFLMLKQLEAGLHEDDFLQTSSKESDLPPRKTVSTNFLLPALNKAMPVNALILSKLDHTCASNITMAVRGSHL